jgi:hypothetical protein
MSLYSASLQLLQLEAALIESEGETTEELDNIIKITQENFEKEVLNIVQFQTEVEAQVAYYQKEIDRIEKLKKTKENLIERLEQMLLNALTAFGKKDTSPKLKNPVYRLDVGTFRLSTRTSTYVNILDENTVPDEYKKVSVTGISKEELTSIADYLGRDLTSKIEVSKSEIKKAIESEQIIPGAELASKINLSVK